MRNIFKEAKKAVESNTVDKLLLVTVRSVLAKPLKEKRLVFHNENHMTYTDKVGNIKNFDLDGMAKFTLELLVKANANVSNYITKEDIKGILIEEYKKGVKTNG